MTDNSATRRSIALETRDVEELHGALERLRGEVADLRASRQRLVQAADDDRRTIERDLHDGVHQHLVALAVNLQLAGGLVDGDPAAAKELLDELGRDVQQALDEAMQLAQQIHPPLLGIGGLTSALRSAAASTGTRAAIEVPAGASYPAAIEWTVYLCCLEALAHVGAGAQATIVVREEEAGLAFEIAASAVDANMELDRLRDRVEALGGRLTIRTEPGRGTRVSGSLPL